MEETTKFGPGYGRVTPVDASEVGGILENYPGLKGAYREGDAIYRYSTARALAGHFGLVVVRDGNVVARQLTGMS